MAEKDTNHAEKDTAAAGEPKLPFAGQESAEEERPPLYIGGYGPLGQGTPDVATGSTPVTRHDD